MGYAGEGFAQWLGFPIINIKSWWKIIARLDGNTSCNIDEACGNSTIVHAYHNQSSKYFYGILERVAFFDDSLFLLAL